LGGGVEGPDSEEIVGAAGHETAQARGTGRGGYEGAGGGGWGPGDAVYAEAVGGEYLVGHGVVFESVGGLVVYEGLRGWGLENKR
jgi:hypothetical protein